MIKLNNIQHFNILESTLFPYKLFKLLVLIKIIALGYSLNLILYLRTFEQVKLEGTERRFLEIITTFLNTSY